MRARRGDASFAADDSAPPAPAPAPTAAPEAAEAVGTLRILAAAEAGAEAGAEAKAMAGAEAGAGAGARSGERGGGRGGEVTNDEEPADVGGNGGRLLKGDRYEGGKPEKNGGGYGAAYDGEKRYGMGAGRHVLDSGTHGGRDVLDSGKGGAHGGREAGRISESDLRKVTATVSEATGRQKWLPSYNQREAPDRVTGTRGCR